MKKLVLVIMCAFVMVLFISLNYLLWDRENQENSSAYKDASIAALGRDINNLQSTNTLLKDRSDRLESEVNQLVQRNDSLQNEKSKLLVNLNQKNEVVNQLKQMVDIKPFEALVVQWAELINNKKYEQAYQLQSILPINQQIMTLDEFINTYKTNIKNIKVTAVDLHTKGQPDDKKGDITLKVSLDVILEAKTGYFIFKEGKNEKFFTVIFSNEKKAWIISEIQ